MKEDNLTDLVEIMFKIFRLMKEEMSFTNNFTHLSILQIQTLVYLNQNENISMSHIADYFRIELPSATSLINKLCDQKLVNRSADPDDRRLVRISLTEDGKALLEQAIRERRKKIEKILSYLSASEESDLKNIFNNIKNKLQK